MSTRTHTPTRRAAANGIPRLMKAAAVDRFGPPSRLKLHRLPVPHPRPGEVLIALEAAGVGTWDASIRDGSWRTPGRPRFPLVPGIDGAGVVVAAGPKVKRVHVGDRVYAYEFGNPQGGFYAEFVAADADHVGRVPKGRDLRQAAAIATTGLTALQGVRALRLRPGETVLIFGASGAVGTIAVQLAARRRARVLATASGRAAARLVLSLGARTVVDARRKDAVEQLRAAAPGGVHAVFALAGGDELERCLDLVRPGGRLVHPNGIEPAPRRRPGLHVRTFDAVADPQELAELNRRLGQSRIRAPIAATYPLAKAAEAHRRLERGHVLGRIVLQIRRATPRAGRRSG